VNTSRYFVVLGTFDIVENRERYLASHVRVLL
jgi:hypothetical protein